MVENKSVPIKLPKGVLDELDIEAIVSEKGQLREDKENLIFTREQFNYLLNVIDESGFSRRTLSEANDKSFAVRVSSKIISLTSGNPSNEVKASCLSAIVGLFKIAPEIATRLLSNIK